MERERKRNQGLRLEESTMAYRKKQSPLSFFEKERIMEYLDRINTEFSIIEKQFSGLVSHVKSLGISIDNLVERFTGFYINVQKHIQKQDSRIEALKKEIEELKEK